MITVAKSTITQAAEIHAIEQASFSEPWSKIDIAQEIAAPLSICLTACCTTTNKVTGYITTRNILGEGHISNIAVAPSYRQKGIGSKLIEALITEAKQHKITGLTLEVRKSNTTAQNLYKKHGFMAVGTRKNYYSAPEEDAIIMWKYFEY
ncbi:MAG: ribosomal protein S18-alanine N-acetyltransferase [Defluviitaleaceae bacterium]|nr:ribosomal protein S18-alanine N-acetyltransferase [Defluviitaleaceae bacterium]